MNNFSKLAIAGAVFAFASVAAQAQIMRVSVPFKFHAGSQVMPAGSYEVRVDQAGRKVTLRSVDGTASGFMNFKTTTAAPEGDKGSLVFNAYGSSYFLHQVQPRTNQGVELFTSRAEREVAKATPSPETTTITEGTN